MTKSRTVIALFAVALVTYSTAWLVPGDVAATISAWSLTIAAAALALSVSSWRAARVVVVLVTIGAFAAIALAWSEPAGALVLSLAAIMSCGLAWRAWWAAPQWKRRNRYQIAPPNPWTSLDQGIDPTE